MKILSLLPFLFSSIAARSLISFESSSTNRDTISVDFYFGNDRRLSALLGVSLPDSIGLGSDCSGPDPLVKCRSFGDFANVTITDNPTTSCSRVEWTSKMARRLEDCFLVDDFMYGGPETYNQHWPINSVPKKENAYVSADYLQGYNDFGNLLENYFLFAKGSLIHVDEDTPLFLSYDTERPGHLCFVSQDSNPYYLKSELKLAYTVCTGENIKAVHQRNFQTWYKLPKGLPDQEMLLKPLWSTWAQFRENITEEKVLALARDIIGNGFVNSSHVEIDDKWETCYGENEFDTIKFPNPSPMIDTIKDLGLRVTLWVHPFINTDCPSFSTGLSNEYFVKDGKGKPGIAGWWAGNQAGAIDVTNEKATMWWQERLRRLQTEFGVDSFKFDAGEVNWLPYWSKLEGDETFGPNIYSTKYVEAVAPLGGLIETRVGRMSQEHPVFVRIMDRDSHWRHEAGLRSVIPAVLLFGILGYPFILPDMIGGSSEPSNPFPSKELYLRWLQINVFMPSVQFSVFPWDTRFEPEVITIVQDLLKIREQYHSEIIKAANQSLIDGTPINRPIWWVDPSDPETFAIEQSYMLGDNILVAPVTEEGAVSRDIYLPKGTWTQGGGNGTVYTGPIWLRDFPAPLDVLPYFLKTDSE